jgi:hypothetical protein
MEKYKEIYEQMQEEGRYEPNAFLETDFATTCILIGAMLKTKA